MLRRIVFAEIFLVKLIGEENLMYLHRKLEDSELIDLLAVHTHRLTQIMSVGESYSGEYEICRRTIELIQNDVLERKGFYINSMYRDNFKQQGSAV